MVKRIAITGPESTGKTALTEYLANHYGANKVSEYSREFFKDREYQYDKNDLITIAKEQLKNEELISSLSERLIICDTDLISIGIWSKIVFESIPDWIESKMKEHIYDLYLLCNLDVEWIPGPLRNNKNDRHYIYKQFVNELDKYNFNYRIISGNGAIRFNNAVNFVDEFIING
jgi:nicotinamide riboside kinase